MSLSVTGYYPVFRGNKSIQTRQPQQNSAVSNPFEKTQTPEKKDKKGLSTGAWIGLGALATLAIAGITIAATRGRSTKALENASTATQHLAEHIDFTPAKTIEEALEFGKKNLKVTYNDSNQANLDMLNTVNEMMSKNLKNEKPFDIIHFESGGTSKIGNPMAFSPISEGNINARVLRINTDYINKFDDFLEYVFKHDDGLNINNIIKRNNNGKTYSLSKAEYASEPLNKLISKLNSYNAKSSYKDKMEIYDGFSELCANYDNILKGKNTMSDFSFDECFIHETGHSMHYQSNPEKFNALLDYKHKLVEEFDSNIDMQNIAQKVSNYSKSSPLEFVAEVYKGIQKGKTFSDDVMKLYKKYGGPSIEGSL